MALNRVAADLEDFDGLRKLLRAHRPDVVVNAGAYTAVDKAERDAQRAGRVNADAPRVLAEECADLDSLLVHYSTDYVFDGCKSSPYVETDEANPQSVYGQTKLDGERAIQQSGCRHLIFRTSWVYSQRGSNFLNTILRHAAQRETLEIVSDQYGAPTSASLVADVTAECVRGAIQMGDGGGDVLGLYHLTAAGHTSWHGFASYFLDLAQRRGASFALADDGLKPITTDQYESAAIRPKNSRLSTERLREAFGVSLPDWRFHVDQLIATMQPQEAT
jgi:dTDP-4-dehydrorhamnose reductase